MTKEQLDVDEPLARRRKVPRRLQQGRAPAEFAVSPKDEYRRVYFEALDFAVTSIRSRFDQNGFKTFVVWNSFFSRHVEGSLSSRSWT